MNGNQPNEVDSDKKELYRILEDTEINNFIHIDLKVLDFLDVRKYFSLEVKNELEKILRLEHYKVSDRLTSFVSDRKRNLNHIRQLKTSLTTFGIEEEVLKDKFQIIFSLPDYYKDLGSLEELIKDVKNFLNELNSKDEGSETFEISSVSNGSIDFFIECGKFLAENFSSVLGKISDIYECIKLYEDGKKTYDK